MYSGFSASSKRVVLKKRVGGRLGGLGRGLKECSREGGELEKSEDGSRREMRGDISQVMNKGER